MKLLDLFSTDEKKMFSIAEYLGRLFAVICVSLMCWLLLILLVFLAVAVPTAIYKKVTETDTQHEKPSLVGGQIR